MRIVSAVSLFSGCGGDTLGMESCGVRVKYYTEILPVVQRTHQANFPESRLIGNGDMTKISDEEFLKMKDEEIDMIFAGFPCQGFSNAGKKKKDDSRNSLFLQFVRCVRLVRPKIIIGENVKGLLSRTIKNDDKDEKPYITVIQDEFNKIGYDLSWKVYNCEKLIPQVRQRLIIVGVRSDLRYDPGSLLPEIPTSLPDQNLEKILSYSPEGEAVVREGDIEEFNLIPQKSFITETLQNHGLENIGSTHPYLLLKKNARNTRYPDTPEGKVYPNGLLSFGKRISPVHAEIIDKSFPSKTIICTYENQPRLFVPQKKIDGTTTIRCINVDELKQIQGFPVDFKLCGTRKDQIHMIGNAVPPPLVSLVVNHIQKKIENIENINLLKDYENRNHNNLFEAVIMNFEKAMENPSSITITRKKGNTQELEKQYITVFEQVLNDMNLSFTRAGSQKPVDYIIHHPDVNFSDIRVELKRTSTSKIMCNDTFPGEDIHYVIIHEKKGMRWCKGSNLLRDVDYIQHELYQEKIEELRLHFKKNGNVSMFARPNFSIDISHLFEKISS